MTRGASEIGLYIASSGKQSAMLGFLPLDEGDAPDSYGIATHAMNQVNGVTGAAVNQPYFGDTRPDMDENLERTDWKGDDKDGTVKVSTNLTNRLKRQHKRNDRIRSYTSR